MQLMGQGPRKACVLFSMAMCLDVDVNYLEEKMGSVDEPFFRTPGDRYRSHHPQECIDVARIHGYALVYVETNPCQGNQSGEIEPLWGRDTCLLRLESYLGVYDGLLHIGGENLHMCAWCSEERLVYDPNGRKYPIEEIEHLIGFYAMIPNIMM